MRIGGLNIMVTLDEPVDDGTPVVFQPARVPVSVRPGSPGPFDEQKTTHVVEMRFHPQVGLNTRMTFTDRDGLEHQLFVKGVQNVDMQSRWLSLLCEEVLTP